VAHRQVSSPASIVVDGETAQGPVVGWKVGLGSVVPQRLSPPTVSLDPGRWSSGCVPGRFFFSVCFLLLFGASISCGSFQSLVGMGLQFVNGWWLASGVGRRRWNLEDAACRGSKDLLVFLYFVSTFVLIGRNSCSLYPLRMYLYWYSTVYGILNNQYRYVW
jgi:hypothetical protein